MSNGKASDELKKALIKLVETKGIIDAAKETGVGRDAITRMVAGFDVRNGTIQLAETWFARHKSAARRYEK